MSKKFFIGVAGYFFATMLVAVVWHMVLFHDKYVEMGALTRGEPIMPFGVLAIILQGIVFSYFYPLYYKHKGGGHPLKRGIEFSLFMGLTVYTVMVFATVAKFQIEPILDFVVLSTIFQLLQYTLVGAVIGTVYGRSTN